MRAAYSLQLAALAAAVLIFAGVASAARNHGKVGDTLTVEGQTKDVVAVTLVKIQDPATGHDVGAGKRVIGVMSKGRQNVLDCLDFSLIAPGLLHDPPVEIALPLR